jgi:hypothetical protein
LLGTVDGTRTRAARIESPGWQPAATTALRAPYGTRTRDLPLDRRASTPAGPTEPGGGSEDRTRTPVWAFRFRDGCRRRPSAGPSTIKEVRRAGLEPARPRGDLVYSQAGQPAAQPTHVPQRWLPDVFAVGRCGGRPPLPPPERGAWVRRLPDAVHCPVRPHSPSLGSGSGEATPRPCDR